MEDLDTDTNELNLSTDLDCLEIGFVEQPTQPLISSVFPSKIGGRPAWLAFNGLPSADAVVCPICGMQLTFLVQVYAPIDGNAMSFHRTLFVFMCQNGECYTTNTSGSQCPIVALRCQLPRENAYFPFEPPNYDATKEEMIALLKDGNLPNAACVTSLCQVCGLPGSKHCGGCGKVNYCSREHQEIAWRAGHKTLCPAMKNMNAQECLQSAIFSPISVPRLVLPELDLVLGPSKDHEDEGNDSGSSSHEQDMGRAQGASTPTHSDEELDAEELESVAAKETPANRAMRLFKKSISSAPDQVLRYHRNGKLLDVCSEWLAGSIPDCEKCGSKRQAEMQILPQMLIHLNLDAHDVSTPDWASIKVYTCSASCPPDNSELLGSGEYVREFVMLEHFD